MPVEVAYTLYKWYYAGDKYWILKEKLSDVGRKSLRYWVKTCSLLYEISVRSARIHIRSA
ncbi:hypothetical protein HMPREF9446_03620 [Bacteroides fluxus YIT 12057]|uniref:Uncharacterized protein n=1 Tax=Bacteroides fluxus YIT 12057 TaxID=763034 RepID=F3PXX2_9BACE|nr:hypothetical protein HMPREF9446_03620 [Bacteroides fluxus YIT 12057]